MRARVCVWSSCVDVQILSWPRRLASVFDRKIGSEEKTEVGPKWLDRQEDMDSLMAENEFVEALRRFGYVE